MSILENNSRIAKNTFILYLRMFFTLGINLYTSRIILNTLGKNKISQLDADLPNHNLLRNNMSKSIP